MSNSQAISCPEMDYHVGGKFYIIRQKNCGSQTLNENVLISLRISRKFVSEGPVNNILALVQIMAWHRTGDKPLSKPTMA